MGRAAMQPKFVPVNLNNSYGEGISPSPSPPSQSSSTSSSSTSSFGSALHRTRPHGGLVLLTRPSKSSLSALQAPMLASPGLLHLHKENAKTVWNRQQAPIVFKSDLVRNVGNETLAAHRNLSTRLRLMPHTKECNESMCSSRLTAESDTTSKQVPLLREEDFPSLCMLPCSHPQTQHGNLFGFEQEGKMLQSSQMRMHSGNSLSTQNHYSLQSKPLQPLHITMLTTKEPLTDPNEDGWGKNHVQVAGDRSENSVTTCGDNWTDDERETLSTSTGQLEDMTNYHGVWRGSLGLKDQASRWDLATSTKESNSAADCLIVPCDTRQARGMSAHSSVGNLKDVSYKKNVPDSNATQDDTWQSNKLKRLYGSNIDSACSMAEVGCLRGLQGGCYLECNAEPFLNVESIFKLKLNVRRRRKNEEAEGDNFRDLERESFEAELEKVQEILEQERLLVVEGQESMAELAMMPDEEPINERELESQFEADADNVTEKSLQLQGEIDTDKCSEVKAKEGAFKEVRPQSAREEERRLMLLEEERRKERAAKKLLELEERIAKREAERSLANTTSHSSDKNGKMQPEFSVTCNDVPEREQLKRQHGSSLKLTLLSSLQKGPLECSGMVSCRMTGQEAAALPTAGSLHDLDIAEMASKELQVVQATEALKFDDILQTHDKDILVKGENLKKTKPEKGTSENNKQGACATTEVLNGGKQCQELWMGASESYQEDSCHEDCDGQMREGLFYESEGESQQNMTCNRDLNSTISTVIKTGGRLCDQAGDGISKSHAHDYLKLNVQGTECGEIGIEDMAVCLEFQEPFEQVLPNTNAKIHDNTEITLKSSWYETKAGLAEHKALPECFFFPFHPNSSDAFSSQLGSLQQPFSALSVPPAGSASFLVSTDDQQEQHAASSMDMCSTAPFMLHAIQIGSIQMPIGDDDPWMLQFSPLHCKQASSFQFGQLCLPSTDQPLLMAGSNIAVVGQTPEHQKVEAEACTGVQQAIDLTKNCKKVFWSAKQFSLSSDIEQVIRQADSMETSVIQFGDLSSSMLQKQLSTGKSPFCLSHANEKSPEHQVNAEFSPLPNTDSNGLKGLDLPVDFAENPAVNCQQASQNALVEGCIDDYALAPDFGFKKQNQDILMSHQIDNAQLRKYELFSAFPGRKKRGNAGPCAGVNDRKYWRACTMKMKYVKVSHFMPERVMPVLEAHNNSIHRRAGRFVYKRKEFSEGDKACQAIQEPAGILPSNAITMLENQCSEEPGACQRKSEISMYKNAAKASKLQTKNSSKQSQFVTSENSAMPNGVVCVFKQQGIDSPYTIDDFIEVKSRRQMLRKQRKEEDETKSGPKPCKTVAHQQRSSKVVQPQRNQWNHHK